MILHHALWGLEYTNILAGTNIGTCASVNLPGGMYIYIVGALLGAFLVPYAAVYAFVADPSVTPYATVFI